jgi:phage baseplate assembly protein W
MDELYPTVSDEFIKEYLNRDIIDDVYDAVFNISAILGDKDAWLTKPTANLAVRGLVIDPTGTIQIDVSPEIGDTYGGILPDEPYTPIVSYPAYLTYLKIVDNDSGMVLPVYTDESQLMSSPLLKYSADISQPEAIASRAIYVELYHVYLELMNYVQPSQFLVSRDDLTRIDANIRWLCSRIEGLTSSYYDLVEVLRDVQVNLAYLRNLDKLFEQTKAVEMELLTGVKNMKYMQYVVKDGDTLPMIAQRLLEDASRWIEIATLNDLEYPYVAGLHDGIQNTAVPGDTISIPVLQTQGLANLDDSKTPSFGVDLLLTTDLTNLSFGRGGEFRTDMYGDLALAKDIDSLSQDLIHALLTPFGSLPYHPEYGSWFLNIVGQKNDKNMVDKAVIEVMRVFRSDARVQDVINAEVVSMGDTVRIECDIVTESTVIKLKEII